MLPWQLVRRASLATQVFEQKILMRLEYLLEVLVKVTRNSMLRGARLSLGEIDRHVNNGTQIDWILDRSHVVYTSQQQALAKWSLVLQIRIHKDDDRLVHSRASTRRISGAHCSPSSRSLSNGICAVEERTDHP